MKPSTAQILFNLEISEKKWLITYKVAIRQNLSAIQHHAYDNNTVHLTMAKHISNFVFLTTIKNKLMLKFNI